MKNVFSLLFVSAALVFSSCSKDDDSPSGASAAVATSLKDGTWHISSYSDNGVDETSDFSSFTFTFASSGTVTATNSVLTATGTWSSGRDDSKHKLYLGFSTPALFEEIDEDWEIVTQSSTQVSLKHVSGGSGETDLLVFTKN
ncbi:MAG: hypothetical protein QM687_15970 [Ferruginibacter sp.]